MKKIISVLVVLMTTYSLGISQIKPEMIIDADLDLIQLNNGDFKFLKTDLKKLNVKLYNSDNTLFKEFNLRKKINQEIENISILDLGLKGEQNEVFLLFESYTPEIQPIEDFKEKFKTNFTLNLVKPDGEIILQVDKATDFQIMGSYPQGKLIIFKLSSKGFKTKRFVEVYSLNNLALNL